MLYLMLLAVCRYVGAGTNLFRSVQRQQRHYDHQGDLFALGMVSRSSLSLQELLMSGVTVEILHTTGYKWTVMPAA